MYALNYKRPSTLAQAIEMLESDEGGRPLAGGQSLVAAMKLRLAQPTTVVDLGGISELRGIAREGDAIVIGAMTRHADVAASDNVRKAIPALADLANSIADQQVRNMGTLGGSIAYNDPAGDYPAALLGLGATVRTSKRRIPADDFFLGMYETALESAEIITAVEFPIPQKAAYEKFEQQASGFAIVGVFVALIATGPRVAVIGASSCVFRASGIEQALAQSFTPDAAKGVKVNADMMNSDMHGSAEYRAHLVSVIAARAVAQALMTGDGNAIPQEASQSDGETVAPAATSASVSRDQPRSQSQGQQAAPKRRKFPIELSGTRIVPATIEKTFAALLDPDLLKECIEGCQSLEKISNNEYKAVMAVKVGPISARFSGKLMLSDIEAPRGYSMHFEGQGGVAGFGKGEGNVALSQAPGDPAATSMHYEVGAQIGGKLAQIGSRLINSAARKYTDDFFSRFARSIASQPLDNGWPSRTPLPGSEPPKARFFRNKIFLWTLVAIALLILWFISG